MEKYLALTFDDGPSITTLDVLKVLEKYNIAASFFVCGNHITEETEGIIRNAVKAGCEICNHTENHLFLNTLTEKQIEMEINSTAKKVERITGYVPKFIRPPYIAVNDQVVSLADAPLIRGYHTEDWNPECSVEKRTNDILQQVQPGGIILMHDFEGNDKTVKSIEQIIPSLQNQGYRFLTVSDLFSAYKIVPCKKNGLIYSNVFDKQ